MEAVEPFDSEIGNPAPVGGLSPGADPSIVDVLQQDFKALVEVTDVHIRVEGYEKSGLTIKYVLPESSKELTAIADRVQRQTKDAFSRGVLIGIDTMIHLCDGLYVQPEGVEEPVELDPEETGLPVKFDPRLAVILGMEDPESCGARAVVRKLFANNEFMILSHSEKLNRWLMNTKADMESEFWQLGG